MALNFNRLMKLFKLMGSEQDGEVLAAVHQIKKMLAEEKSSWGEFCGILEKDVLRSNALKRSAKDIGVSEKRMDELFKTVFGEM